MARTNEGAGQHFKSPLFLALAGIAGIALIGAAAAPLSAGCCEEGNAEMFAEHIQFYGAIDGTDLPGCTNTTQGLYDEFGSAGGWSRKWYKNDAAWESDWRRSSLSGGQDDLYSDAKDFSYFCGHGNVGTVFFTTQHTNTTLVPSETAFGDVDVEWVTFDTSKTLRDTGTNLLSWRNNAMSGRLHLLIGWHDSPLDGDTGGEFADELIDHGILDGGGDRFDTAWYDGDGGCTDQDSGTTQTIVSENWAAFADHLHGEGDVSSDPVIDNVFMIAKHNC